MQQIVIHEARSYLTAAIERHLLNADVTVRWTPFLPDFFRHIHADNSSIAVLHCVSLDEESITAIAQLARVKHVIISLPAADRRLEPVLREIGVRSVLCESDPPDVMIETVTRLLVFPLGS